MSDLGPEAEAHEPHEGENEFTVEPLDGEAHWPRGTRMGADQQRPQGQQYPRDWQHPQRAAGLTRRRRVTALATALLIGFLLFATSFDGLGWQGGQAAQGQFAPTLTQTTILPVAAGTLPPPDGWQTIPRPPTANWVLSLAVLPTDPQAALACTGPKSDPTRSVATEDGAIGLWRTSDGGQRWQRLPIPASSGTYCEVQMALGAPQRLLLDVFGSGACADGHPLFSTDGGQHWRSLSPPLLPLPKKIQGCSVSASISPHHIFALGEYSVLASITTTRTSTGTGITNNYQTTEWNTRSDDDGLTWTAPADTMTPDMTLAANALGGEGVPLTATGVYFPPDDPSAYSTRFWTSSDLGATWQPEAVLPGFASLGLLAPSGVALANATARKPVYALTGTSVSWEVFRIRVAQISGHTWALLPPLPIRGTSAAHTGITEVLTATPSGELLVLGPAPGSTLPAGNAGGDLLKLTPWLWAWDPVAARWNAVTALPPNVWPSLCATPCWSGSVSVGAAAEGGGAYLWLTDGGANGAPILLRLRLPAGV